MIHSAVNPRLEAIVQLVAAGPALRCPWNTGGLDPASLPGARRRSPQPCIPCLTCEQRGFFPGPSFCGDRRRGGRPPPGPLWGVGRQGPFPFVSG
jgi:hypothetical protein